MQVYTDGGCDPNPGPGGWAAVICWGDREWVLCGNDPDTTNNRMEIQAAAAALALLEGLTGRCRVEMHTDSLYLRRGIAEWLEGWVRRDWRTRAGQPVKNQDLWQRLYRLVQAHDVAWHWLKGHGGHPLNERADRLATEARRALGPGPAAAGAPLPAEPQPADVLISVKASGSGGWGAVLRSGGQTTELSGRCPAATANALLIVAATEALRALHRPGRVDLISDAKYLVQGASTWATSWQANGWRARDGQPVANQGLWQALLEAARPHQVRWMLAQEGPLPPDLARAGQLASRASRSQAAAAEPHS